MRNKIKHFFRKTPGERMPNNLGWLAIFATDALVLLIGLAVYASCQGCAATSRITRHTPGGDVTIHSESYAGGLVSSYNEEFDSDADYARCLADRRTQRVTGGSWVWSDDQMTCYWQNAGGGTGSGGFGSGYGYAWGAPPALVTTPGIR
jgi:hypothetical protein